MKRGQSLSSLKDKAWKLVSLYVRLKDANSGGYNMCFTCDKIQHYKKLHAGHYIHNKLDYELDNLKPQCVRCNKWLSGNLGIYGERLAESIGLERMKEMRLYAYKKGNDYTRTELKEIIENYQQLTSIYKGI